MSEKKRLFLLDAYALIFRGYYALIKNPRINSKGMDTSAIMGFMNSLFDVIRREKPDHLAVCFDKDGSAERTERIKKLLNSYRELMVDVQRINSTLDRATTAKSSVATAKVAAGGKGPAPKPAVGKSKKETPKDEVLKTIKRYKKGIDIATLIKITGHNHSTVRSIVYRATKEGAIKRVRRGVYAVA